MPREAHPIRRFDPNGPFVARRRITLAGATFEAGADVPADAAPTRRLRQLYEWRRLTMAASPVPSQGGQP